MKEDFPSEFLVPTGVSGRIDKVLAHYFPSTSRSFIKSAIEAGEVTRHDGSKLEPKTKVLAGDKLILSLTRPNPQIYLPAPIPLNIIHEDSDLIVLNKSPGMVVHPGDGTDDDTLVHALLHHCGDGKLCPVGAPDRPGIVHRLDKDTSGLMVIAKTEVAFQSLVKQFASRLVDKKYIALVTGEMPKSNGFFKDPIARHPKVRVKMCVSPNGKFAHTDWKVIKQVSEEISMVECRIHTGRTHQIRVHFANAGHPLVGDLTYGYNPNKFSHKAPIRIMLHAKELSFIHPVDGERYTYEVSLYKDIKDFIDSASDDLN